MSALTELERVLVTGASGFIASHAVQQLLKAGYAVRGTVRSLANETKVGHLKKIHPNSKHPLELVEADLNDEQSWIGAVKDCDYVLHIASPFPVSSPKDEAELITPAVEGTLGVLRAAARTPSVKRVVLTSSLAAVADKNVTEADWPDANSLDPYSKSKLLAEQAAWDFVKGLKESDQHVFELAVINPGYVLGPALSGTSCTSMEVIKRMMNKDLPLVPKINFCIVDVRDVAAAHIVAMKLPEANGERHILATGNMWMADIARVLKEEFKDQGYSPSAVGVPHVFFKIFAAIDSAAKRIAPYWGRVVTFDNSRMTSCLKIDPYPVKDTLIEMAYSLIDGGFIKKSRAYRGNTAHDDGGKTAHADAEKEPSAVEGRPTSTADPEPEAVATTGTADCTNPASLPESSTVGDAEDAGVVDGPAD